MLQRQWSDVFSSPGPKYIEDLVRRARHHQYGNPLVQAALTELAARLAATDLRPKGILHLIGSPCGGSLSQPKIYGVWETIHNRRPPSGQDITNVVTRLQSVASRQQASSYLMFYVARGGELGKDPDDFLAAFLNAYYDFIEHLSLVGEDKQICGRVALALIKQFRVNTAALRIVKCRHCCTPYLLVPEYGSRCLWCGADKGSVPWLK